jgi:hypothetical protein
LRQGVEAARHHGDLAQAPRKHVHCLPSTASFAGLRAYRDFAVEVCAIPIVCLPHEIDQPLRTLS